MELDYITAHYENGWHTADRRERPAAEAIRRWRANMRCARCGQPIARTVQHVVRGIACYHPSCAERAATTSLPALSAPAAPTPIAVLSGSAGRLFDPAGCHIPVGDGHAMECERFAPGSLDATIARGSQFLDIDHSGLRLRGRFLTLREDAQELRFRFELHEGPRERQLLRDLSTARGCSIRFRPYPDHARAGIRGEVVYGAADLVEISICVRHRAAWYGSRIAVE